MSESETLRASGVKIRKVTVGDVMYLARDKYPGYTHRVEPLPAGSAGGRGGVVPGQYYVCIQPTKVSDDIENGVRDFNWTEVARGTLEQCFVTLNDKVCGTLPQG